MRKLTNDDIQHIIYLINNGKSVREIAETYGVLPQTIYYHLNKHNVSKIQFKSKRHKNALKRRKKAISMYSQGKSLNEIAKELGVKNSTVKRYLNGFISDSPGRRKKVDKSVINLALRMIREGHDYDSIAERVNASVITLKKAIRSAVKEGIISDDDLWLVTGKSPVFNVKRKLIEMLESGVPPVEVARATGVSLVYINGLTKKLKRD